MRRLSKCVLLLFMPFVFIFSSGFSVSAEAEMNYFGKCEVSISILSDLDENFFNERLQKYIDSYNQQSKDIDVVTLLSTEKNDGGYVVKVKLRRIDKLGGVCIVDYSKLKTAMDEGNEIRDTLTAWCKGDLRTKGKVIKGGELESVRIDKNYNPGVTIKPKSSDGNTVDIENLIDFAKNKKNCNIVIYKFFDVAEISEIKISFPSKIVYHGGLSSEIYSENGIVIKPAPLSVAINGEKKENLMSAMGYVVFETGTSPVLIVTLIIVALLFVAGVIILFLVFGIKQGGIAIAKEELLNKNRQKTKGGTDNETAE